MLHFPDKDKIGDFEQALQRKIKNEDFDFRGVWFPDDLWLRREFKTKVNFSEATFNGRVGFDSAIFRSEVIFWDALFTGLANFNSAVFECSVYFTRAVFDDFANFGSVTFSKGTSFLGVKFKGGADFSRSKFSEDADFCNVAFEGIAYFHRTGFLKEANFSLAEFDSASFDSASFDGKANFERSKFKSHADFFSAEFKATAVFHVATFGANADFSNSGFCSVADFNHTSFLLNTHFGDCTFDDRAVFGNANFGRDTFFTDAAFGGGAVFTDAIFRDRLKFAGSETEPTFKDPSGLDLQFATVDNPEHVSFHTLRLRPHCFANVDPRKFDLTYVDWEWHSIKEEVECLRTKHVLSPHRALAIACRRLAVNSEENQRYGDASRFRYMAMDAKRRTQGNGVAFWKLNWWYWLASGYSERVFQACLVLLGIWFVAALLYVQVGFARWEPKLASEADIATTKKDDVGVPLKFSRALTYSAGVMTLQKPEPRPATTAAQTVVLLETILGPVQAALLALAIRRKFMR